MRAGGGCVEPSAREKVGWLTSQSPRYHNPFTPLIPPASTEIQFLKMQMRNISAVFTRYLTKGCRETWAGGAA